MASIDANCTSSDVLEYLGIPRKIDGAFLRSAVVSSGMSVLLLLGACTDQISKFKRYVTASKNTTPSFILLADERLTLCDFV